MPIVYVNRNALYHSRSAPNRTRQPQYDIIRLPQTHHGPADDPNDRVYSESLGQPPQYDGI